MTDQNSPDTVPTVSLAAGTGNVTIPQLGFGVWQVPDDEVGGAIDTALKTGYRSIDTARIYGNEDGVGRALAATSVPRDEIFLTTKVWNDDQGYDETIAAFEKSAQRLQLGDRPLDLYLIHWPVPARGKYVDTFRALLKLRDEGRIRAVGVCNFNADHLTALHDELGEWPAINQIELHPLLQQQELRTFHAEHGIATEAWSPLGQGGEVLQDPKLVEIADRLGKSVAQVILRWHIQLGNVVIPKSVTPSRIAENFDIFGFELSEQDLATIAGLDQGKRLGPDPASFDG
ncbi:aldo/keto reductase [Calidifontibacter sp. DB0510]|uniref:Aldo/keto reductase n=1 Tax=Metallococcus carri TaxID=1656884 RepID=A0A967B2U2_9MICO|nr:aldo/keto reductase [Metallococcus carri]NHN56518.1 aldo/keto reductase [Metallococcus carri]NOP38817.1 aldo/keto reductase [Calidifontibacter sp. DB2511S]